MKLATGHTVHYNTDLRNDEKEGKSSLIYNSVSDQCSNCPEIVEYFENKNQYQKIETSNSRASSMDKRPNCDK